MIFKNYFIVITIIWSFIRAFISMCSLLVWIWTDMVEGIKFFMTMMFVDFIFGLVNVAICIIFIFSKSNSLKTINSILFIFSSLTLSYIIFANFYSYFVFDKTGIGQGIFCVVILILQNYIFLEMAKSNKTRLHNNN
jgi:hypothetical protein